MKYNSLTYSVKTWITSVMLAPFLFIIISIAAPYLNSYSGQTNFLDHLCGYLGLVVLQLLFSTITWILFWLLTKVITDFCYNISLHKPLVFITGILLTIGSFKLVFPDIFYGDKEYFYLMISNCLCIGCGTWFYKLKPIITEVEI